MNGSGVLLRTITLCKVSVLDTLRQANASRYRSLVKIAHRRLYRFNSLMDGPSPQAAQQRT